MPSPFRSLPLDLSVLAAVGLAAVVLGGCGRQRAVELEAPVRYGQAAAAEAPGARRGGIEPADAVLLYRRGAGPCEVLLAGTAGLAAGPCGGELSPRVYARPERVERVQELAFTYTSFELESEGEELEFHGVGQQVPSPAEQRMVLELARRLMTESLGLRRTEAYRLAFAWHRQGSGEQPCDDLAIYLSGEAVASSCAYRGVEVTASLTPEQLARLYDWVDRLRPFQVVGSGGSGEGDGGEREATSVRVLFVGRGEEAGEDEVAEISRFAQEIYRTMTDEELARVAAEAEREEEQRLLEAQQAAGLVPPPVGGPRPPSQRQPSGVGQATGRVEDPGQVQAAEPGQPLDVEPLPPPEPELPPPAAVGVEDQEQVADPGPDEEDEPEEDDGEGGGGAGDGGSGDAGADADDDGGGFA
ncbi:MAG TPA: hypothetical protein VHQ65_08195 [Thermoanaerobaculia bacterium]|nr:hypothetical protein [Thermoanaerobaculia bacterium]